MAFSRVIKGVVAGSVVAGLGLFGAVPAQAADTGWKLGFAFGLDDGPIYPLVLGPAKIQAEKLGISLVEGAAKSKCETQVSDIQNMINSGVKAVTFLGLCGDGAAYDKVVAEGKAKGVTMVSYAFKAPGADGSITFDDVQAGTKMGNDAVAWIKKKYGSDYKNFSWGALPCSFAPPSVQERTKIATAIIQKATGKKPLTADCKMDPASAQKTVETWLKKDKKLKMVVALVDAGGLGAAQAFKNAGTKPGTAYVAGVDGQTEALQLMLKDGPNGPYQASYALPATGPIQVKTPYNIINKSGPSAVLLGYTGLKATDPAGINKWINTQLKPWGLGK